MGHKYRKQVSIFICFPYIYIHLNNKILIPKIKLKSVFELIFNCVLSLKGVKRKFTCSNAVAEYGGI